MATLAELDRLIDKRAEQTTKDLVDYCFLRLIQLVAVIFVLIVVTALIVRFVMTTSRKEGRI